MLEAGCRDRMTLADHTDDGAGFWVGAGTVSLLIFVGFGEPGLGALDI